MPQESGQIKKELPEGFPEIWNLEWGARSWGVEGGRFKVDIPGDQHDALWTSMWEACIISIGWNPGVPSVTVLKLDPFKKESTVNVLK